MSYHENQIEIMMKPNLVVMKEHLLDLHLHREKKLNFVQEASRSPPVIFQDWRTWVEKFWSHGSNGQLLQCASFHFELHRWLWSLQVSHPEIKHSVHSSVDRFCNRVDNVEILHSVQLFYFKKHVIWKLSLKICILGLNLCNYIGLCLVIFYWWTNICTMYLFTLVTFIYPWFVKPSAAWWAGHSCTCTSIIWLSCAQKLVSSSVSLKKNLFI